MTLQSNPWKTLHSTFSILYLYLSTFLSSLSPFLSSILLYHKTSMLKSIYANENLFLFLNEMCLYRHWFITFAVLGKFPSLCHCVLKYWSWSYTLFTTVMYVISSLWMVNYNVNILILNQKRFGVWITHMIWWINFITLLDSIKYGFIWVFLICIHKRNISIMFFIFSIWFQIVLTL